MRQVLGASADQDDAREAQIVMGLLQAVERESAQSQRVLAARLGVAVGLVNAYLRRCVRKGLVKVRKAPARRYVYYLTPDGFAEKSRLTMEYMSYSLHLFRQARVDMASVLHIARDKGLHRIALFGASDLAEIAIICALEADVAIVAVVDRDADREKLLGVPVVKRLSVVEGAVDGVLVTDLVSTQSSIKMARARFGDEKVIIPSMIGAGFTGSTGE